MSTPILATKLYIPRPRTQVVSRPRLIDRLNAGLPRKLTLVSAPAGFGKTTLVTEWLDNCGRSAAWLSLDEGDKDPARFLTYVVAALQTIVATIGEGMLGVLQSPQPPPIESILTTLLNEIATIPDDFILVLDDYHLIDAKAIDNALNFLLEHLPPQLHLVITTREDPQLPLARLRARSELNELRAADLRFTPDEAAAFLNRVMGLNLSTEDVAVLESRTEGWIAGLQLAAISVQGHADTTSFIRSFTGSHRFVLDYLVEEVLHQQSERVQTFLLQTSILDGLCGALCDAVMLDPAGSGQEMLAYLEQANLFIIPLDDERRWYRYHHLFADLLRQRLHQSGEKASDAVLELHLRASEWYEANGMALEAFRHAAAANDVDRAARLIEGDGMPLHFRGIVTPVLNWLDSLPTVVFAARPSLWVVYASALTFAGQHVDVIEPKLQAAEAALQTAEPDAATRDLIGHIATLRAMLAIPHGQLDIMLTQSRRALEYLNPDNLPVRTAATWALGMAYQFQKNWAAASQAYSEAIAISQASNNFIITLAATTCLGIVQESENQLHLAVQSYQRVLELLGDPPLPYACEAYLGLARVYYQWNELAAAEQYGEQSARLAPKLENIDTPVACSVFLARLKLTQGDVAGAVTKLADAEQFARQRNFLHQLPDIVDAQVLTLLRQDDLAEAVRLAQTYDQPFSQARVDLAQGDPAAAVVVLEPLRQLAETNGWQDDLLRVLVLQAIAYDAQGEQDRALQVLSDSLALAEPGGAIRVFIDEGLPMAKLLFAAAAREIAPEYVKQLIAAFDGDKQGASAPIARSAPQALTETLSDRELEVLQLVAQGLSNREISEKLFLALDTVKGHNRRIFGKLQVQRRTEAVARARELGLV